MVAGLLVGFVAPEASFAKVEPFFVALGADYEADVPLSGPWSLHFEMSSASGVALTWGGPTLLQVLRDGFQFLGSKVEDVGTKVDELRECVTRQGDRIERLEDQVAQGHASQRKPI